MATTTTTTTSTSLVCSYDRNYIFSTHGYTTIGIIIANIVGLIALPKISGIPTRIINFTFSSSLLTVLIHLILLGILYQCSRQSTVGKKIDWSMSLVWSHRIFICLYILSDLLLLYLLFKWNAVSGHIWAFLAGIVAPVLHYVDLRSYVTTTISFGSAEV